MEQERFDQLARSLAVGFSRRGMVRNLAGTALGGVLAAAGASEAGAKQHRKQVSKSASLPANDKTASRKKKHRCPAGQTRCQVGAAKHGKPKTTCVDLKTNAKHCGKCATACDAEGECVAGSCTGTCNPQCQGKQCGDDGCGGSCGGCGAHGSCQAGQCVCDAGWADCSNGCDTPLGTPADCLHCGDNCASFAGECSAPVCRANGCGATPTNEGQSCQGGAGTCSNGTCVPSNICIEALQACVQGGAACCEGRTCQTFDPGCWGPQYCCRASGESCDNACDCCSTACAYFNGGSNPGTCL